MAATPHKSFPETSPRDPSNRFRLEPGGEGEGHAREPQDPRSRERGAAVARLEGDEQDEAHNREARPEPDHDAARAHLVLAERVGAHEHEDAADGAEGDEDELHDAEGEAR